MAGLPRVEAEVEALIPDVAGYVLVDLAQSVEDSPLFASRAVAEAEAEDAHVVAEVRLLGGRRVVRAPDANGVKTPPFDPDPELVADFRGLTWSTPDLGCQPLG